MRTWLFAISAIAAAGCLPTPRSIGVTCDSSSDCADDEVCFKGYCRLVCNDRSQCGANESCIDGVCLPVQPGVDSGASDGSCDAQLPDASGDANLPDAAGDANLPDAAGDANLPDAVGDTSQPDAVNVDAHRPDTTPVDTSGCGAMPACPQCGTRTCADGNWGPCHDGTCGANSQCTDNGTCECTIDECSGTSACHDGDVYACVEDAYGCGAFGSRTEDCTGTFACSGSPPACHDTCSSNYGDPCARTNYCGATYDCSGACTGGTTAPSCHTCGSRNCLNLTTWSDCQNGTCDDNSYCNSNGYCVCSVDECSSSACSGNTWYVCNVDDWGCGRLVASGSSCGTNKTCQSGQCCSIYYQDPCGGECNCGACGTVSRGSYDCDGTCVYRPACDMSVNCDYCCSHTPC
ncbi:MAG: hypothetical protein JXR83_21455 [Deltaproteobacteria bacterium]|nr:hypothetical protein [Deltaproteobacteria bacterium]